jgi:hypothetical protein
LWYNKNVRKRGKYYVACDNVELNQRYIQADTVQDLSVKALYGNRYGVALVEKTRRQNHKARLKVFGNL